DLHNALDSVIGRASRQGWSSEEINSRLIEPVDTWMEEQDKEMSLLSQLSDAQKKGKEQDQNAEEEQRKSMAELAQSAADSIKKMLSEMLGRDQAASTNHTITR